MQREAEFHAGDVQSRESLYGMKNRLKGKRSEVVDWTCAISREANKAVYSKLNGEQGMWWVLCKTETLDVREREREQIETNCTWGPDSRRYAEYENYRLLQGCGHV